MTGCLPPSRRAGTEIARHSECLDAIAWYDENSRYKTHPVAGKEANSWGLYDRLGNVWEWCADEWSSAYTSGARETSESPPARRVIRGGSWVYVARGVRRRSASSPCPRPGNDLGFRCAEFRQGVVSGAAAQRPSPPHSLRMRADVPSSMGEPARKAQSLHRADGGLPFASNSVETIVARPSSRNNRDLEPRNTQTTRKKSDQKLEEDQRGVIRVH